MKKTNCMIMRAGTSKGIFFKEEDMPANREEWPDFLLDIMGSPDKRQIDGLGGANSLTSKVAIIKKSNDINIDVDYTFAQVSIAEKTVDFKGNCGNISSGVGSFAIESGIISASKPIESIVIKNTNTGKVIQSDVRIKDGEVIEDGSIKIPGVPGSGSRIDLTFFEPEGAVTGKLLPTGKVKEKIITSIGDVQISIVDSANPLVFMRAEDLGLTGKELHYKFTEDKLRLVEEIRSIACELCGFAPREEATAKSPAVPKATIISEPKSYMTTSDEEAKAANMDMTIRMMSMQKPHQALAITGAVCTATAYEVKGSLVNEIVAQNDLKTIRLGHPGGVMNVQIKEKNNLKGFSVERTARVIMEGKVRLKRDYKLGSSSNYV